MSNKNYHPPPKFGEYKELNAGSPTKQNVSSSDFSSQLFGSNLTQQPKLQQQEGQLNFLEAQPNSNIVEFTQVTQDSYVPPVQADKPVEVQLEFNESNLKSQQATGSMKSKGNINVNIKEQTPAGQPSSGSTGWFRFLNLSFLRPFFDVDTFDVLQRIFYSTITFYQPALSQNTQEKPDLYGPLWVSATLVFLTAAIGNFIDYARSKSSDNVSWSSDASKVVAASVIFYGYQIIASFAVYFALRYKQAPNNSLVQTWCIYGYVLAIYIPISFLCVIPNSIVQWILVLFGTVTSALCLIVNLGGNIREVYNGVQQIIFLGLIALFHLVLGVVLKVVIFKAQKYKTKS